MMPESEWSMQLEGAPDALVASDEGTAVIAIVEGNQVCILNRADGTVRGVVETEGTATPAGEIETRNKTIIAFVQDDSGTVYGINLTDGTEAWRAAAETVLGTGEGSVYLAAGPRFWARDPETGDQQWSITVPTDIAAVHDRNASTLVEFTDGADKNGLVAVDPSSGERLWEHTRSERVSYDIAPSGVYTLIFGEDEAALGRLDERTGGERWLYPCEIPSVFRIAIDENAVYACIGSSFEDRAIVAIDANGGSELWRCSDLSLIDIPTMYAREDALFVDTIDAFATLDPESGNVAWTVPLEMSVDEVRFEPDSIHVWAGDALRIQRNTGRVEWRTGGEPYSDGTLSTELAYSSRLKDWVEDIGTGAIDALERDTGDSRWSFAGPTDAEIVHTTDEYALLAAVSGSLGNERSREIYLLDPDDGSDQWSIDVDDGHVVSGDALFVADGASIHGLGLVNDPAAFAHSDSGTDTSGPSDSSPPADQKREETGHESDSATESDAMSDSNSDDETPAFCPECGGSLSEYENPAFCIHCGREL